MKMRAIFVDIFLLIMAFLIDEAVSAKKGQNKFTGSKRNTIVQCCGANSCTKPATKLIANTTSSTSSKSPSFASTTTKDLPTATDSEPTSDAIVDEQPTTDASTTEIASSPESSTSTFTTTTVTTPTTTITTPTTTITTTTTTKPPTKEELILGTCDTSFIQDPTLMDTDGTLKDPEKYGFWVQSCGKQFLFGKSLATWRDNFIRCYKIGMEPVTFENAEKLECFSNLVSKWKYSSNYWTSGLRVNESDFSWCTKNGSFAVDRTKLPWATGQPQNVNNSENCLHLNVTKATATFTFSDRLCTDPQIFACQGPPTPAPSCSSPVCPNITCAKNPNYYTSSGSSQFLTLPNNHGRWFTYNGRTYVFGPVNKTETFFGAMQSCCEIGMTLLSLEYDYKYKSVIQAIKENTSMSDFFWTSGSDRGCESNFGYCVAKRLFRQEAIWASGQPDNAEGNESAVAVFITSSQAQLYDFNEEKKFRYICEARDTSKSKSGGTAVRDECASIYNVSQAEIDDLLNPTTKKDMRIKCFAKCLGENSGLMVNGKFLENEVLAILEKNSGGNLDELQKSMGVMDECGNSSSAAGMDECDKAAQMIKCSSEKAPDVLNGIITAMDQSMPIEQAALPPVAVCPDPFACTVAPTYAQEVANCTGNCTTTYGFVRHLCGKKYFYDITRVTLQQAYINCCAHGTKLASIETPEEVQCLLSLNTTMMTDWTWVAVSKVNTTSPRWCTSNVPFSFAGFAIVTHYPNPPYDSYAITPSKQQICATTQDNLHYPLCQA
ncbi:uncharacterized protein LOC132205641 [Neocloeon triangulifer]|uniref:uncharacterized protein LOC132205641 n=1 Tax=Neocloeon triangulifer TaxID=2078957 RepID=UPI00286F50CE|nr:uncharacterized protein LOC132205641 [Neocloeon triangulifer]